MDIVKIEAQALKLAIAAKPGHINIAGNLYTFEFCQKDWVYQVYENGFAYIRFNTKKLASAKKMLKEFLEN